MIRKKINWSKKLSDGDKSARVGMSAPRRRQRAHTSRFNTQPVTPEELEKASRISPLAMSLVKPPDTELLIGLRIKDQQELMMIHAEATLSQCSSHSGSRASSQPGSRRDSFTTADVLPISSENTSLESRQTLSITLPLLEQDTRTVKAATEIAFSPQTPAIELTRGDSEPRGILKKMKSTESVSDGNTFRILHNEIITETTQTVQCQGERAIESQDSTEPPNAECVHLESHGDSSATQDKDKLVSKIPFSMWDEGTGGQSSTDIPESGKNTESKRRSRLADRKTHTESLFPARCELTVLNSYTLKNDSKVKESLTVAVDVEDWQSNKKRS
ncbi:hypothetical protein C0Q70_01332 [Pomacea canaliculata]|uniref:Uncharacterized protein n=1 Tax=Pomacea canaliculata TaxID=400727 RepID=A0A2T7PZ67_POMCA|nr:hypothetical protein C0Q70_01332 [Pomacea canaliculata]